MASDDDARCRMHFEVEQDEDGYPESGGEALWVVPVGGDSYRIDSIPFYVRGISADDLVRGLVDDEGVLLFAERIRASGRATLRVFVNDPSEVPALRESLRSVGCESEGSDVENLFSVDIPDAASGDGADAILQPGFLDGRWDVEEANVPPFE